MSISKESVIEALKHVNDPDLHQNLVSLNMIKELKVDGKNIEFTLELTTPACPMKNKMKQDCIDAIHQIVDPEAEILVNISSRVTSQRAGNEQLKDVKNIIAVASGKGGVGKSTVAVNLAIALQKTGAKVGLIDSDIYGPSIPIMFDVVNERPRVEGEDGKQRLYPIEKYGIKLLSIGFFIDPDKALIWRGPMASNALLQLFNDSEWGEIDYLVVDLPPGTGDIHLTLAQQIPVTGIVVVTTPQEVALSDARKAISMFNTEQIRIPVLGLVENMSYFTPTELPENKYYIFGKEGGLKLAQESKVNFLGEIPLVQGVCESGDNGRPVALNSDSPVSKAFTEIAENISQQIAIINAVKEGMKQMS